tara:strand:- start:522 stop:842 length:321 start_codon:yes stop_codon:yes gene_type:complete
MDTGRLEKIEAMLEIDPHDTFLRYSRAMEWARLGKAEESLVGLKELAAEDPPYVPAFFMAAQQLAQQGDVEEAAEQLRAGIEAAEATGDSHAAGEMREFLSMLPSD